MPDEAGDVLLVPSAALGSSFSLQLGLDEGALEVADSRSLRYSLMRTWVPEQQAVVLGRSSPVSKEVDLDFCRENGVEVCRRCSGGQTIVTGPGCLMYAVLLDYRQRPELRMLDQAHYFVMKRMQRAIASLGVDVQLEGTSDLTLNGRKFSGNSLRCKRDWFVYHGTMICQDFDLSLISQCLKTPIRQPDYRAGRSHEDFLTRLPVSCEALETAIIQEWNATESMPAEQQTRLLAEAQRLAETKYATDEWTFKVP